MRKFLFLATALLWSSYAAAYTLQYHPFLLQTKDSKGITLAKTLDAIYGEKITVKDGRCHFFEAQPHGSDIEYELDRCKLDYSQKNIYTQADKLNGIEIKGQIWVQGNSFRTRQDGKNWTEWKTTELYPALIWFNRTGVTFLKKNGEFVFEPTKGLNKIRGDYKYMSKFRAEAIKSGTADGMVIQESESGKIVIQESKSFSMS